MNAQKLAELIDALLENQISEADFLRLEAELSLDADSRKSYYERVALTQMLSDFSQEREPTVIQPPQHQANSSRPYAKWTIATCLAAMLFAGVTWPWITAQNGGENKLANESTEQIATGFAILKGQSEAIWSDLQLTKGGLLTAGDLHLQSGLAHLELFSGVTMIIEGNAKFTLVSPMEVRLQQGKLRAHVPPAAHGFKVTTDDGRLIDMGTDFAINVNAEYADIHVLDGEILWQPNSQERTNMKQGEALRWSKQNSVQIDPLAIGFVGPDDLHAKLNSARVQKRQAWERASAELRDDSRLVMLYQTGQGSASSRSIENRVLAKNESSVREGAVVGATRSMDRWERPTGAYDFSPTGSRIRVSVPGEFQSISLYCWVKINSLDRWYNSLFLTDGHDLHEPHWQIMNDGRLFFSVKKNDQWNTKLGEKDKHIYYSPPFWDSSLSGQWLMLATVYDVPSMRVTHFLNGEVLGSEDIPKDYLVERVKIGNASICNWGEPERDEPQFAVRNLNGSMDEFALFNEALSADEIRDIYDTGKPQ